MAEFMGMRSAGAAILCSVAALASAQAPAALKPYVSEDAPVLVLMHVRVIDGTGAAPAEDQRIDIEGGKIARVQSAKLRNALPPNAKVLDLGGKTVIPGLVGMHASREGVLAIAATCGEGVATACNLYKGFGRVFSATVGQN